MWHRQEICWLVFASSRFLRPASQGVGSDENRLLPQGPFLTILRKWLLLIRSHNPQVSSGKSFAGPGNPRHKDEPIRHRQTGQMPVGGTPRGNRQPAFRCCEKAKPGNIPSSGPCPIHHQRGSLHLKCRRPHHWQPNALHSQLPRTRQNGWQGSMQGNPSGLPRAARQSCPC